MKPRLVLVILLVWAAALGIYLSSTVGFSAHELFSEELQDCVLTNTGVESNGFLMRLFFILAWVSHGPHSDLYLRFPCLVCGLASLVAVYFLGAEIATCHKRLVGVLSAFYLGVNVLFIGVLCHMRFYTANMLWVIFATYCLIKARRRDSWRWLCGYAACMVATIGTMMLSSLVALPHLLYYVGASGERRRAWGHVVALGSALSAWFALLWVRDPEAAERFDYSYGGFLEVVRPLLANGDAGFGYIPQNWLSVWEAFPLATVLLMICSALLLAALSVKLLRCQLFSKRGDEADADLAISLAPFTVIWAVIVYQLFSMAVKPIAIPHNFSWVIPFMAITLAQATRQRHWRWLYLAVMLAAVPHTHAAFLANAETNQRVMRTWEEYRRSGEPLLVATSDQPAWHYLRSEYGINRQRGPLTHAKRVGVDLACGDGLLVYEQSEFPEIINAICQQRRPACPTVWILTFQNRPSLAKEDKRQRQAESDAEFYRRAMQRALGGVCCDCLIADGDGHSVLYRLSLPAVRQQRPQPLRYRWRLDGNNP